MKTRASSTLIGVLLFSIAGLGLTGCGASTTEGSQTNTPGQTQGTTTPTQTPPSDAQETSAPTLSVAKDASHQEVLQEVRAYMSHTETLDGIKKITLKQFTPDKATDANVLTGKLIIGVDLEAGAKSNWNQGDNTRFVLMTKVQGVWTVEQVTSSPQTSANPPASNSEFEKAAQKLQGTLVDVGTFPVSDNGKEQNILGYLRVNVEKNLTSGGTIKAGETAHIDFMQPLTEGQLLPKKGDKVIVLAGPNTAGQQGWAGKLQTVYIQQNGTYYTLNKQTVPDSQLK